MEILFAFLLKLTTIFVSSGILSLLAFYVANESNSIAKLILEVKPKIFNQEKVSIIKKNKLSSNCGLFEIFIPGMESVKIFSSHKGMKIV